MKDLIILLNDMEMFQLILDKMPKETKEDVTYHFVNDLRMGDQRNMILSMIHTSDCTPIKKNFVIHSSNDINTKALQMINPMNEKSKLFFDYYRYNLQFTIPIYFSDITKKIFMTDDDVVFYQDPSLLFEYKNAFIRVPFNRYDPNKVAPQFWEYLKVFDFNISVEDYNKDTFGAGTFTYTFEDKFIEYVNNFYSNEVLMDIFDKHYHKYEEGYKTGGYVAKSFFADQFWNFYFHKIILEQENKFLYEKGEVRLVLTRFKGHAQKKMLVAPVMIHYAAGTKKKDYIPWLRSLEVVTKNDKTRLEVCN